LLISILLIFGLTRSWIDPTIYPRWCEYADRYISVSVYYFFITKYSETCLNQTLSKPKTCLSQTYFTVPSSKCLCYLNLCKPNTCLNWTDSSIPKVFGLDRFYCMLFLCNMSENSKSIIYFIIAIYLNLFSNINIYF